jgi:hypothetical protein
VEGLPVDEQLEPVAEKTADEKGQDSDDEPLNQLLE